MSVSLPSVSHTLVLGLLVLGATSCVGKGKFDTLQSEYSDLMKKTQSLEQSLSATGAKAAKLGAVNDELAGENQNLEADNAEMRRAIQELRARQASADSRVAAYQDLVKRFATMIDAGTLSVSVVNGRLVVQLPTDILFPSGSAEVSAEGREQLLAVGEVLATLDRDFQVEGHTDTDRIKTERFPSNWELASGRATTVLRTLEEAGVPVTRLSTAGFADTHPVAPNTTPEGKALNRRIEIVLVPDMSLLPGFDQLEKLASGRE